MTTDPFIEAARAYARERYPSGTDLDRDRRMVVDEFAAWARAYLAAQEPTDAETEAAANALADWDGADWHAETWDGEIPREAYRAGARRALSAARAVGRGAR